MPVIVACGGCEAKLKVPENSAAKALRCPKCKGLVPLAKAASEAVAVGKPPAPAKAPPPPPKEEEFEVNEAVDEPEDEFEVNEAADEEDSDSEGTDEDDGEDEADEDEYDEESAIVQLGFAKVKDVYKEGNVPKDARDAIEKTFVKNERALWTGRPNVALCHRKAWLGWLVGIIALLVAFVLGGGLLALLPKMEDMAGTLIVIGFAAVGFLMFCTVGTLAIVFRKSLGGNVNACYIVTNKRVYIHDISSRATRAFTAEQVKDLRCIPSDSLAEAGDLVFAYEMHGQEGVLLDEHERNKHGGEAIGFLNIEDVQLVRRLMFELMIEPELDRAKKKRRNAKKNKKEKGPKKRFFR